MIFMICTIFLVLYSTFLTRSGILGDTSVHAFTDLGMSGQLLLLLGAIVVPAIGMLIAAWKQIPKAGTEEHILSREFWMLIGAIILAISALHIAVSTSLPVINAIFGSSFASPEDAVTYYNSVQIWIGILIALLSGLGLYLKFKKTPVKALQQLLVHLGVALAGTILLSLTLRLDQLPYYILLFSGLFGASANMHIVIRNLRKKFKLSGAAISHLGFGLIMVALIVALANSSVISKNVSGLAYSSSQADSSFNRYNVRMNIGETVPMGNYHITYLGREQDGPNFYYRILYEQFDDDGELAESFELRPHLLNDPNMGIVANPATKRYAHRDIFTHVSSVPVKSLDRDVTQPRMETRTIMQGDSFWTSSGLVVFESFTPLSDGQDFTVIANLKLHRLDDTITLQPVYSVRNMQPMFTEARYAPQNLTIALTAIKPGEGFTFRTFEVEDWVIMKAIVFPFINLLWFGIVLTITGMLVVLRKRILEFRRQGTRAMGQ
jgi:cytochrome c-type biogenesis protein CcmF